MVVPLGRIPSRIDVTVVSQTVSYDTSLEPAPIAGLTRVKSQGQNGACEIRLRPHQHRRPDDGATALPL